MATFPRHQALDRTYELVNEVLRAERHPDELSNDELVAVRTLVRDLDMLLVRWRTPEPVRVYRGLRSRVGFDVDESPAVSRSFLSTTVFRDVAIGEFTVPPALYEVADHAHDHFVCRACGAILDADAGRRRTTSPAGARCGGRRG